jgi:hypothetical protein
MYGFFCNFITFIALFIAFIALFFGFFANIFIYKRHQHWRGLFLKEFGKFDSTVKELIDGHPSTNEFNSKSTSAPSRRTEDSTDFFATVADDAEVDALDVLASALSDSHGETAVELEFGDWRLEIGDCDVFGQTQTTSQCQCPAVVEGSKLFSPLAG